jgi:hypothetical protein
MEFIFANFKRTIIVVLLMNLILGGLALEYCLEFWTPRFTGNAIDIPFWQASIAGIFVGELAIPIALITLIYHT